MGERLRRYTSIPAVLDTLQRRQTSLLEPASWSDRNDREIMRAYAERTPSRRAFAYCMAIGNETAHHWQVFADRGRGACIVFDRDRLLHALAGDSAIRHREVAYVNWRTLSPAMRTYENLPFLKRVVFRYEREYRVVATPPAGVSESAATYDVRIPLTCITSIYFSGEAPTTYFETVKQIICAISGCERLPIRHSGLLKNVNWTHAFHADGLSAPFT